MKIKKQAKQKSYPEHDKLSVVINQSQIIGSFLEWLDSQSFVIAQYRDVECLSCGEVEEHLVHIDANKEKLLAIYFNINLDKLELEKRSMLDQLRQNEEV